MRFIGNKEKLAPLIYEALQKSAVIESKRKQIFCDCFAGSVSMGRFFKQKGFSVISCDMLYFSYCLQRAYLHNATMPKFLGLDTLLDTKNAINPYTKVLEYLNNIESKIGFISTHYAPTLSEKNGIKRMYFSDENARKIDSIREMIEFFKTHNLINENEYFILLATLLESVSLFANVAGVYAAFCKKWDSRAIKPFRLKELELISTKSENLSFCGDSFDFLQDLQAQGTHIDILYLDPPYNHRQYAPNYHLLETIARYDNPSIKGIAGLRDYATQKSRFCNAKTALSELEKYIKLGNYTYFVLSYNSEGIMQKEQIEEILKPLHNVKCVEIAYPRFKSNAKKAQRFIKEYVWIGRV